MERRGFETPEIKREADRIERNRAAAFMTVALAEALFDVALARGWADLEDLAIAVDGDAQRGVNYTAAQLRAVLERVSAIADAKE